MFLLFVLWARKKGVLIIRTLFFEVGGGVHQSIFIFGGVGLQGLGSRSLGFRFISLGSHSHQSFRAIGP